MAISNELSGDIAAAICAAKKDTPGELRNLKETILQIHSVLEQLANYERNRAPATQVETRAGNNEG